MRVYPRPVTSGVHYRAILVALQGVTGVPVTVGEKDREFVPVGVKTDVTKGGTDEKAADKNAAEGKSTQNAPTKAAKGTANVYSVPAGADLLVDGQLVGNCPASLKLTAGKHTVTAKLSGYKDRSREITVQPGSEVQLTAKLQKQN